MKRCIVVCMLILLMGIGSAAISQDGLIIRLDADSLTGLADGDFVTNWADSAAADTVDGTVTQVGSNNLPGYYSNVLNGHAVVRFTNSQILGSAGFSWPDVNAGLTIFAVLTGDSSGETGERPLGIGHATGTGGQIVVLDASTNTTEADGGSGFRFNNGKELVKSQNPLDTGFHIVILQIAQGAQYNSAGYYVDDLTAEIFDNIGNGTNVLNLPATGNVLTVGNSWINGAILPTDFFSGDVAEILVYNKMLSTAEMSEVNDYLNTRYFVPEPATLVLLGIGGLSVLRRRRK